MPFKLVLNISQGRRHLRSAIGGSNRQYTESIRSVLRDGTNAPDKQAKYGRDVCCELHDFVRESCVNGRRSKNEIQVVFISVSAPRMFGKLPKVIMRSTDIYILVLIGKNTGIYAAALNSAPHAASSHFVLDFDLI